MLTFGGCCPCLTGQRVETAMQLLASGSLEIRQIAALLCFCDQSHFTQVFRKKTGMTPAQYRRRNESGAADPQKT
jgi:AraC-like DNA-binding protein